MQGNLRRYYMFHGRGRGDDALSGAGEAEGRADRYFQSRFSQTEMLHLRKEWTTHYHIRNLQVKLMKKAEL